MASSRRLGSHLLTALVVLLGAWTLASAQGPFSAQIQRALGLTAQVLTSQQFASPYSCTDTGTGEETLASYTLPAGALAPNQGVQIDAVGHFTALADTRVVRVYFGSVVINSRSTTSTNVAWQFHHTVSRTAALTTAQTLHGFGMDGSTLVLTVYPGLSEALTSPVLIKVTGQNTLGQSDICVRGFTVTKLPRPLS